MIRRIFPLMMGAVLLVGFLATEAGADDKKLKLRVDTHGFQDFDQTPNGVFKGGAAFYVSGDICKELDLGDDDCTPIGKFHCWGWLFGQDQPAVVSQEFDLFGRGKIQVQGVEDAGPRAVVGGTGKFRNVRGEATGFDLSQFMETGEGEFIANFKLKR